MGLDIRLPIGLLFSIFGLLLIGYGALGDKVDLCAVARREHQPCGGASSCWRLGW